MQKSVPLIVATLVTTWALFTGCETTAQHATASGKPEVTIQGHVAQEVQAELSGHMINIGYNIQSNTPGLVVYEKPIESFLGTLVYGTGYDSTPNARITATILEANNTTRVILSFFVVSNPGSAYEKTNPLDQSRETLSYQETLNQIKARLEAKGQP